MSKFPDVFGTTDEFRDNVLKVGYLDIQKIKPEDVVDVETDCKWLPDFWQVYAIINIKASQNDSNSILLMANQRLVKCPLSPNELISWMKLQFPLDSKRDVGDMAKSMGITRLIPYVCGDFLLMPVDKKSGSNNSWIRLYTPGEVWDHQDKQSLINYPNISVLRVPHSQVGMEKRKKNCEAISGSYQKLAASISSTIDLPGQQPSGKELRKILKRKEDFFKDFWSRKLLG